MRRQWKAEDTVTGFYRQKPEDTKKLLKIYNDISGLNERIYEMQTVKTAFKLYIFSQKEILCKKYSIQFHEASQQYRYKNFIRLYMFIFVEMSYNVLNIIYTRILVQK